MRLSTGLVNKVTDVCSLKDALAGYVIDVWTSVQPLTADLAATGSLLVTVTNASAAFTAETASTGTFTVTGTATGTVATVTVDGVDILGTAVTFTTDVAATAVLVAAQINRNPKNRLWVASATGLTGIVTLTAVNGMGTAGVVGSKTVAGTVTGSTTYTGSTTSAGVSSINGLNFDAATLGVISKVANETWSGTAVATGTAGWFRIRGGGDTGSAASSTAARIDGSIGTSGADMNLGSLAVTSGAPFIIPTATITLPMV